MAPKEPEERVYLHNTWDNMSPTVKYIVCLASTEVIDGHRPSPRLDVSTKFLKLTRAEWDEVAEIDHIQRCRERTAVKLQEMSDNRIIAILQRLGEKAFNPRSEYYAELKRIAVQVDGLYESTKPDGYLVRREDIELAQRFLKERVHPNPALDKIVISLEKYIGIDYAKETIAAIVLDDSLADIRKTSSQRSSAFATRSTLPAQVVTSSEQLASTQGQSKSSRKAAQPSSPAATPPARLSDPKLRCVVLRRGGASSTQSTPGQVNYSGTARPPSSYLPKVPSRLHIVERATSEGEE